MILNKNSGKYRELLWKACCIDASGTPSDDGTVTCNLCGLTVAPGTDWDESHGPIPKAFGGASVWIAHRKCNRDHGAKLVTPMVAKAKRQRRKHLGIERPGLGKAKLPAGRDSRQRKKLSGEVVERVSQIGLHRKFIRERFFAVQKVSEV